MRITRNAIGGLFAAVLGFAGAPAGAAERPGAALDAELGRIQASSPMPGFCASVVDAGGVRYENGFGFADVATKRPYAPTTVQPIGSISKTLIGVALMKAVEQGLFTLDTPVNDLLPFKVVNPQFPDQAITVRHLATHTSGIVDREDVYEKAYEPGPKPKTALKDFLADYFGEKGRYYSRKNFAGTAPGQAYRYTNIGAALAGYLIEAKSGTRYAEYVKAHVFEPAGMAASGWVTDESRSDNATLYENKGKAYPVYSLVTYPDGGLHTSCADLGRYLSRVIAGYRGADSTLLAAASFRTMLSPQFDAAHPPAGIDAKHPNQGIFWEFLRDGDIGHYGGDPGVTTFMSFDPRTGLGRILLTNIGGEDAMTPELAGSLKAAWTALREQAPAAAKADAR
jgi:CubicO group peptidase (beta-lactamase class C family)